MVRRKAAAVQDRHITDERRAVRAPATADSEQALASLTALAQTRASVLLPGHGAVWREGAERAAAMARAAGPS